MSDDRWRRLEEIYHDALAIPPDRRNAFLNNRVDGDSELRRGVESLLGEHHSQDSVFDQPAWEQPAGTASMTDESVSRAEALLAAGAVIGPYRITGLLGEGGMGQVYRAHDSRLQRSVAIKVLLPGQDVRRLVMEARVVAALSHPNVVPVFDVGHENGLDYLVEELAEGESLRDILCRGPLDVARFRRLAVQIAEGLAAAHRAGIIHRDLKPRNIIVSPADCARILDFGLATRHLAGSDESSISITHLGAVVGTAAYMSPEQVRGSTIDARSDIFSYGAVIYEMITGRRAFARDTITATLAAVVEADPPPAEGVPLKLAQIIHKCLNKDPSSRFQGIDEVSRAIDNYENGDDVCPAPLPMSSHSARTWAVAMLIFVLVLFVGGWLYRRGAPARWAREVALPEAIRLVSAKNDSSDAAAFALLYRALKILPQDPALNRVLHQISHPVPIHTTPPGASVYIKPYRSTDPEWIYIGQSPLEGFLLPEAFFRWRITKPGFRTVEAGVGVQGPGINFVLDAEGSIPAEMVRVRGGGPLHLGDFWMDRYEVTNKEFKSFVDGGGYRNRQYWRQDFSKEGRVLSWAQAMQEFRDATGQPGPSSWEAGAYPQGHDDFPVNGLSWYEAAAYAEFAKKQLPTVYHWDQAASLNSIYSDILQFSNFDGRGPVRVGSRQGIGAFGAYDMAGNVKEWCWNAVGTRRYILGGGWSESRAFYVRKDALSPFDRSAANGFRCVRYPGGPPSGQLTRPVDEGRDYRTQKPASDGAFRILQSVYSYDQTELNPVTELTDESSPYWRVERIAFDAAYEHQRVTAWLYLPRNAKPPYQTIMFFPAGHSRVVASIDEAEIRRMDFLITGGRAVLFPEYQGTFGRRPRNPPGPSELRDEMIQQCKDFQRSVDYLETRPDIAHDQLGFFGISQGSKTGVIALALEHRIRAAAIAEAGLWFTTPAPEVDEINFAPHIRIPILMMSGRDDFVNPMETSQVPLFRLLGTPEKDKRHVLLESGHRGPTREYIKDTLDWFDRYLGPVNR